MRTSPEGRFRKLKGTRLILPDYDRLSIVNVASTLLTAFGLASRRHVLEGIQSSKLFENVDKAILLIIDALGYTTLNRLKEEAPTLWSLFRKYGSVITSVAPSTTSVALLSVVTESPPIEHGIVGYKMYVKEIGMVINTIKYSPAPSEEPDQLERMGIEPSMIYPRLTRIFDRLKERGIQTFVVNPAYLKDRCFSRALHSSAEYVPYVALSDMFSRIAEIASERDRALIYAYWGELDALGHVYGPDSEEYATSLRVFDELLEKFVSSLKEKDIEALMIICSDHGQISVDPDLTYDASGDTKFLNMLVIPPSGESRFAYLYTKEGMKDRVRDYIEGIFGKEGLLLDSKQLLEEGIWGFGNAHPKFAERVGNYVLTFTGRACITYSYGGKAELLKGRHGGLTEDEMLVPCIATRIGEL